MSKKSSSGGNGLLIAGVLGVGAVLFFGNKAKAGTSPDASSDVLPAEGSDATASDATIPSAPKILAVNTKSTESPIPTGVVSDEDGIEATGDSGGDDEVVIATPKGPKKVIKPAAKSGVKPKVPQRNSKVPPLVSTKLTDKEKAIINRGVLSDELALTRPDLYKTIYIKKWGKTYGQKGALDRANKAITQIADKADSAKKGAAAKAVQYPAVPKHTFVQTTFGVMASQGALSSLAALQQAGVVMSAQTKAIANATQTANRAKGKAQPKRALVPTSKKKVAVPVRAKATPVRPKTAVKRKPVLKRRK